jgi:hypothetical protein
MADPRVEDGSFHLIGGRVVVLDVRRASPSRRRRLAAVHYPPVATPASAGVHVIVTR